MTITAFQIGAFQFTGFQEGQTVGGGGWWPLWTQMLAAMRRRRKKELEEKEERERVIEPVLEHVELSYRALNLQPIPISLVKLIGDKRIDEARELEEFAEVMKLICALEDA
jgi:hypothetical protein